jgi:glycosyltransferase involved in cell wall biosynthesis
MISFVIPAHNEERFLGPTLRSVSDTIAAVGEPAEVIVVDDASTDRTADIAREHGARVIPVQNRKISATRNAGARAARGDVLFFVDADTLANTAAVRAGLRALRGGAVGGGCVFRFDCPLPPWAWFVYPLGVIAGRWLKLVGGCFLFCTAESFRRVGGFPEEQFAAEELTFARRLKRVGRFVVPRSLVVTSGRKFQVLTTRTLLRTLARAALRPGSYTTREGLEVWYGEAARRPSQHEGTLATQD